LRKAFALFLGFSRHWNWHESASEVIIMNCCPFPVTAPALDVKKTACTIVLGWIIVKTHMHIF
jgi:hypothetical protein